LLFKMTNAAITPGTQPQRVRRNTVITDPQPLLLQAEVIKLIIKLQIWNLPLNMIAT
jgi:hypothetical protein